MNCKNCQTPQRTDFKYCPNCGAKVIHQPTYLLKILLTILLNDILIWTIPL